MDNRLVALKLVLDELGVNCDIQTINDRKKVQKAIYLGQRIGVELGYRFGWYLLGPYSTDLTKDYYALSDAVGSGEETPPDRKLRDQARASLQKLKPIMAVPKDVPLSQDDWLELLASHHFLRKLSACSVTESAAVMQGGVKARLAPFVTQAEDALQRVSLLS